MASPFSPTPAVYRLSLLIALLGLLAVTLMASSGVMLRSRSPELALRLAPWDARTAARRSQELLIGNAEDQRRAELLAKRSLARDPTAIAAVVTLAFLDEVNGRHAEALRRFTYAEWLSRRHLPNELWWIEYGVSENDIPLALRHYDIALRGIVQAPDILFPVLGPALAQPAVRAELVKVLAGKPAWKAPFLQWLVVNGVETHGAAALFMEMRRSGQPASQTLEGRLEQVLVQERDYDTAWRVYQAHDPRARRDRSRDETFASVQVERASPFDWNVIDERGGTTISRSSGYEALSFTTTPTSAGVLARQLQLLPSGFYRLTADTKVEGITSAVRPHWELACIDGRPLGRAGLDGKLEQGGRMSVPADCAAQWLQLVSDAGDTQEGVSGTVRRVLLAPEQ